MHDYAAELRQLHLNADDNVLGSWRYPYVSLCEQSLSDAIP